MQRIPQGGHHHLSLINYSFESVRQVEKCFLEFPNDEKIQKYLNEEKRFCCKDIL